MGYVSYPSKLTDEEEVLLKKYAKLKRKKQALLARKAPKPEPPPPIVEKKTSDAAADATLQAKRLLKSGAIKVAADKKKEQTFKRAKRHREAERAPTGYQPFRSEDSEPEDGDKPSGSKPEIKPIQENFIRVKEAAESRRDETSKKPQSRPSKKRRSTKGQTMYVSGADLTEDILRAAASKYGPIQNITMESRKQCAFVTFEDMAHTAEAVTKMNDLPLGSSRIATSYAYRQPNKDSQDVEALNSWGHVSMMSKTPKGDKDERALVSYEDNIF